jgi:NADPH:quinone reductase-like Zn-dependent oxidoreductase
MKAIVQTEYGSADVLRLADIGQPMITENFVLVRVQAAAVHAGDWHLMRGQPLIARLMFGGLLKPKFKTLGCDVAGEVEAVGGHVTQFKPGDQVFGDLSESGFGAFAEYVCVPEKALVLKPANVTFEQAAAVPVSALAALQGLRDVGQLQAGQTILVKGAGGGVGSFAVQIAKVLGAEVSAMCSHSKMERVRSLNPSHLFDSAMDWMQIDQQYDLILDTAAYRSVWDYKRLLKPDGVYVLVGGSMARLFQVMLFGALMGKLMNRRLKCLVSKPNQADLEVLKNWLETEQLKPCLDRSYLLAEVPEAIRYVEQGKAQGKVTIKILVD